MPGTGNARNFPYIIRYNQRPQLPGLVTVPTRTGEGVGRVKVWNADQPGGSAATGARYTGGGCIMVPRVPGFLTGQHQERPRVKLHPQRGQAVGVLVRIFKLFTQI